MSAFTVKTLSIFLEYSYELLTITALPASNSVYLYRQNFIARKVKKRLPANAGRMGKESRSRKRGCPLNEQKKVLVV